MSRVSSYSNIPSQSSTPQIHATQHRNTKQNCCAKMFSCCQKQCQDSDVNERLIAADLHPEFTVDPTSTYRNKIEMQQNTIEVQKATMQRQQAIIDAKDAEIQQLIAENAKLKQTLEASAIKVNQQQATINIMAAQLEQLLEQLQQATHRGDTYKIAGQKFQAQLKVLQDELAHIKNTCLQAVAFFDPEFKVRLLQKFRDESLSRSSQGKSIHHLDTIINQIEQTSPGRSPLTTDFVAKFLIAIMSAISKIENH